MRYQINRPNHTLPIVDPNNGFATDQYRIMLNQIYDRGLIIGTGSPDGVIEAQQGVEYMDEAAAAGSIKWIKQQADIGGDRSLGWVAIG